MIQLCQVEIYPPVRLAFAYVLLLFLPHIYAWQKRLSFLDPSENLVWPLATPHVMQRLAVSISLTQGV